MPPIWRAGRNASLTTRKATQPGKRPCRLIPLGQANIGDPHGAKPAEPDLAVLGDGLNTVDHLWDIAPWSGLARLRQSWTEYER